MIEILHIGDSIVLNDREIIGIFSNTPENNEFIGRYKEELNLRNITEKKRSFILVEKGKKNLAYYSKINSRKLIKRMESVKEEVDGKKEKESIKAGKVKGKSKTG